MDVNMEEKYGSPQREEGPDRVAKGEADEGEIINIRTIPLVRLDDAHIKVEEIPPDFVFPEPPKPEAWFLEPPATTPTAPTAGTPILRVPSAALAVGALVATAACFAHRSRSRRRTFSRKVLQFSAATERALEEERPAGAPHQGRNNSSSIFRSLSSRSCGSLRDRAKEAQRQLATLHELIADGLDIGKHFPWEAAGRGGEESRRLQACVQGLSRRRAKVEQAGEELRVMAEVERLLARLDSGGGGVLDGDGLSTGGDGDGAPEGQSDSDASDSDVGVRGVDGSAAEQRRRRKRPARLSTRAALLLSRRSNGGSDSGDDAAAARYVPGCVFREELKRWCDRLSEKEQDAVDWLKLGLQRWDLEMVDRALAQLRLLELPEIVKEFQQKREDVRSKRWRLREELKAAIDLAGEGNTSRLRKACVKADTFSATDLDEYQSAKQSLDNARAAELEVKARRILSAKGILADPRCNVRLDLASGPTLLLRGDPVDAGLVGGGGGSGLFIGAGTTNSPTARPGLGRRLDLLSEEEGGAPCRSSDAAAGGVSGGDLMSSGASNSGSSPSQGGDAVGGCDVSEHPATAANAASVVVLGNSDLAPWGQPPGRGGAGGGETMQLSQQRVRELMEVRRSAEEDFLECVTKQEDEHRRAYDRDQAALEARDAEETYRQEYIARLDTRSVHEEERLVMERDRLLAEERRREREEEERKHRADADRLKRLWSSDGEFFRLLSAADVALAAAAAAFMKGFSLAPGAVLHAAWGLVVAECAEGGGDGAATAAGASDTAPSLCTSSSAVDASSASVSGVGGGLAGYDGVCGGAGGAWSEAAVAAGGPGGGGESTLLWAWSAAGSTAGAVLRAGYTSAGWLLGQTLGLVAPDVQCEIRVVLSLGAWLVSLVLVMKLVGGLLGRGNGGDGAAQWMLLAAWVWGRFHDWVLHASRELALFFAPAPVLVLAYGRALRYFEQHRRPDGFWWVNGWDVRFLWSRALPAVVSAVLACSLGAQVS